AGRGYLLEPPLAGRTLRAALDAEGPLAPAAALALARDVLNALAYAHHRRVVHGALSPRGISLEGEGAGTRARLLEYGMARVAAPEHTTPFGGMRGDPDYAAPEAIKNEPLDPRADVYSAGVILFEALTGRHPIPAPGKDALLRRLNEACDRLPTGAAGGGPLEARLRDAIARATAKDPARRFPSARAFLRALRGEDPALEPGTW